MRNTIICMLAWGGAAAAAPAVAPSSKGPSVAVLNLEAKNGLSPDLAELLTANLIATVENTGRLGRVVGTKEIESVVGFERQKQLMSCESQSCVAELAGAMGVDYVIAGSVGRVGNVWLFNATLVSTRSGESEGRVSRRIMGTEEAFLEAMDSLVVDLLKHSKIPAAPEGAAAPAAAASPAPNSKPSAPPTKPAVTAAPAAKPAAAPVSPPVSAAKPVTTGPVDTAPASKPVEPSAPAKAAEPAKVASSGAEPPAKGGGVLGKVLKGVGGVGLAGAGAMVAVAVISVVGVAGGSLALLLTGLTAGKGQNVVTLANVGVYAGGFLGVGMALGSVLLGATGAALLGTGVVVN